MLDMTEFIFRLNVNEIDKTILLVLLDKIRISPAPILAQRAKSKLARPGASTDALAARVMAGKTLCTLFARQRRTVPEMRRQRWRCGPLSAS